MCRMASEAGVDLAALDNLEVVGRCGCGGCPTVFFRIPVAGHAERDLIEFSGHDGFGAVGTVLLTSDAGLSQLEVYSADGHEPLALPQGSTLVRVAAV